jgi:hypothetical protein
MSVSVQLENFGSAPLVAEYDAEAGVIRVNARLVQRMRARHGALAAQALIACAAAHERYHALRPLTTEEEAHAYAYAVTGYDPYALETMLLQCFPGSQERSSGAPKCTIVHEDATLGCS